MPAYAMYLWFMLRYGCFKSFRGYSRKGALNGIKNMNLTQTKVQTPTNEAMAEEDIEKKCNRAHDIPSICISS